MGRQPDIKVMGGKRGGLKLLDRLGKKHKNFQITLKRNTKI